MKPEESCSDVVRRAQFPRQPLLARKRVEEIELRAGQSPLAERKPLPERSK